MIIQRRKDEAEEEKGERGRPAGQTQPSELGGAATINAQPNQLRPQFADIGSFQSANAGTLSRQTAQANKAIGDTGNAARSAIAGVQVPGQVGDGNRLTDWFGRAPQTTSGSRVAGRTYSGPTKPEDARGYSDAVRAIASWQGLGSDAKLTGANSDTLNQALLGIRDGGASPTFAGARQSFADVAPSWLQKMSDVEGAVARGTANTPPKAPAGQLGAPAVFPKAPGEASDVDTANDMGGRRPSVSYDAAAEEAGLGDGGGGVPRDPLKQGLIVFGSNYGEDAAAEVANSITPEEEKAIRGMTPQQRAQWFRQRLGYLRAVD